MTASKNLLTTAGELILAALLAAPEAGAQCSVFSLNYGGRPWPGSSIGVLAGEGVSEADIVDAIALWQRGCSDFYAAGRIPSLLANRPGVRTVRVDVDAKVSPVSGVCGAFNAASIKIWGFAVRAGKVRSCGPMARLIAHELGHVLGVGDAPELRQCCNHIMSPIWPDKLLLDRALPGECEIVAAANVPGLGLEGGTTTLVAADLTDELESGAPAVLADASVEPTAAIVAPAESGPSRTNSAGSRLTRFLDQRRAVRRGANASRSTP
jgi:hypothetical protein